MAGIVQETGVTADPSLTEYTKHGGSCEFFKIEIKNIPTYVNYTSIKKFITNKFNVKPHKIKIDSGKNRVAYVSFKSESDKKTALEGIHGCVWKGKQLEATTASPVLDPFLLKQKEFTKNTESELMNNVESLKGIHEDDEPSTKRAKLETSDEPKSIEDLLKEQVAPLSGMPYEEQLDVKKDEYTILLQDLLKEIGRVINQSAKSNERRADSRTKELLSWYVDRRKTDHLFCPMGTIVECPADARNGYRNKCEFSFGRCDQVNPEDGQCKTSIVIGFRLGAYKDGSINVAPVDSCTLVPDKMKSIVKDFQNFFNDSVVGSRLKPFNHLNHEGHLTQLTVRNNLTGQSMVMLFIDQQCLTEEEIKEEISKIKCYFQDKNLGIVSMYFQLITKGAHIEPRLIHGQQFLTEELTVRGLSFKFNISPNAFFQVNSRAAEVCYGTICGLLDSYQDVNIPCQDTKMGDIKVKDESAATAVEDECSETEVKDEVADTIVMNGDPETEVKDEGADTKLKDGVEIKVKDEGADTEVKFPDSEKQCETVILDICCGTGTIGLCLASKCKHVFGIELSKEAIKDAKENATNNGITNVTFYDGKAESIVPLVTQSIRRQFPNAKVVAILDPPRAGLNASVIKSIRSTNQISSLIYVSCEPKLAKSNLIDLVRPASKAYRGDPFIPIKSALVDMFPDTKRAETIFLFERLLSK